MTAPNKEEPAKHTPLPILTMHERGPFINREDRWYVLVNAKGIYNISITSLLDDDDKQIVEMANKIITAVNSYHSLVEQNERLKEALNSIIQECGPVNFSSHNQMKYAIEASMEIAETALKAAEGGVK